MRNQPMWCLRQLTLWRYVVLSSLKQLRARPSVCPLNCSAPACGSTPVPNLPRTSLTTMQTSKLQAKEA